MKKIKPLLKGQLSLTGIVLFLLSMTSCTKEMFTSGEVREFTLKSNLSGVTYQIQVGLPNNFDPAEKYETIYVLDGKEIFGFVANRCKEISEKLMKKNVLVISIGYGRSRSIDYTPTKVSSVTGGAPEFLNFIETQLIPKVEQDFHADTSRASRVILGHSYGGLFGAYAFTDHNKLFGNYLLLSPSLWFDDQVSFKKELQNREKNKDRKHLVFMGIGENEEVDRMLVPFERAFQILKTNYLAIKIEKSIENKGTHMSSRGPNIIRGLEFYFRNKN